MHVFLTGASGFIGQALVRAMRQRGWDVTALVRNPDTDPSRWLQRQGVRLQSGDVTRPDGLAGAMRGADAVLHNAGVYELGANAGLVTRMRAANIEGTAHVLGAALQAGVPRTVYVSTVWALGASRAAPADETQVHNGHCFSAYEHSKHEAHLQALALRQRGLPLGIAMPDAVVGANDHAIFGYLLRLYLQHRLPPMAWGADSVYAMVDVDALADGLCRMAEHAPMGEDFIFAGPPLTLRELLAQWCRHPGGARRLLFVPPWLAWPQMALLEPLQRWAGLPAFLSREAVTVGMQSLHFSSAKAQRLLGWRHPDAPTVWDRIVQQEQQLMARRQGLLGKLRHQAVADL